MNSGFSNRGKVDFIFFFKFMIKGSSVKDQDNEKWSRVRGKIFDLKDILSQFVFWRVYYCLWEDSWDLSVCVVIRQ